MAQTYFLMHVDPRFQFEKIPHCPFKVISRFWGRNEVAVKKIAGIRVCKISADFTNSMLVFFEAAVENIEKMANVCGWWCWMLLFYFG